MEDGSWTRTHSMCQLSHTQSRRFSPCASLLLKMQLDFERSILKPLSSTSIQLWLGPLVLETQSGSVGSLWSLTLPSLFTNTTFSCAKITLMLRLIYFLLTCWCINAFYDWPTVKTVFFYAFLHRCECERTQSNYNICRTKTFVYDLKINQILILILCLYNVCFFFVQIFSP